MSTGTGVDAVVRPARRVRGRIRVPGDKSISHRYAMLAALADGRSQIEGYSPGADCAATLACLRQLGVEIAWVKDDVDVQGRGVRGLRRAGAPLDAQNSGTTLRLMAGIAAAHPFETVLTGDASLRRRPMRRVIDPLVRMGAAVEAADGDRAPLRIAGADLHGIDFTPPVASAQVKSAVLFAGLQAAGETIVREQVRTRDHTERALAAFGAEVRQSGNAIAVRGGQRLRGARLRVPGDLSSAAFWAVAAAALPASDVAIAGVGLNPTRTALLALLARAGARVDVAIERERAGEPSGIVRVRHGEVKPLVVDPVEVPGLIDELPALAALGALGAGMKVTGAAELRGKESDRIAALVAGFRGLGAEAVEWPDGFEIRGGGLRGGTADAASDHRLAMAFSVAALGGAAPSVVRGAEAVQVSYPDFFETLESISE
jgi:3-phosphoshikimate 1-carboxyvinyltransferase